MSYFSPSVDLVSVLLNNLPYTSPLQSYEKISNQHVRFFETRVCLCQLDIDVQ